jgi:hypothetical protein
MVRPGRCLALSRRLGLGSIRTPRVAITVSGHAMTTVAVSLASGASSTNRVAARAWLSGRLSETRPGEDKYGTYRDDHR